MAYADPIARSRPGARAATSATSARSRRPVEPSDITEPSGSPHDRSELARAGLLGSAIAIGVLVGAGAALLFAPQSGEETRADLAHGTRRVRNRAGNAWDDLRDELRWAARRSRKRVQRGVTRGGWAAEDLVERGRRRVGR